MSRLREQMKYFASNQERVAKRMRDLEESQRRAAEEKAYLARLPPTPPYGSPSRRSFSPVSPAHSAAIDPVRYMTPVHDSRPVTPMTPLTPISPISPPPRERRYAPPPAPTPMPSPPGPRLRGGNVNIRPNWWAGVFDGTAGSTGFGSTGKYGWMPD
jgi:hypothetical protein